MTPVTPGLHGLHHLTCICADAVGNVEFCTRVLGLRLVKKTVNFDAPDVYHLYYGDDTGAPGSILTFFEFPDAAPGRAGAGMVHLLQWRVATPDALAFWAERLSAAGIELTPGSDERSIGFRDPEGLALEIRVARGPTALTASSPEIPEAFALTGFDGVRAYADHPEVEEATLTDVLGFERIGSGAYRIGDITYAYDAPPAGRGFQGAGTVHHVAFACKDLEQPAWSERLADAGIHASPVIDRDYFTSIYFREPRGVLFEIATQGPGFAVDENPAHLGERLRLPSRYEPLRERLEATLKPLPTPTYAARG